MDHITKQQLILISLLIAIVTSVATSVATVSLMDGSSRPDQVIYRVIEKSIEQVKDSPTVKNIVGTNTSTKSESSLLSPSEIVDGKSLSLVRVYEKQIDGKKFVALGVALGSKNALLSSALELPRTEASQYIAVTSANTEIPLKFEKSDIPSGLNVFTLQYDQNEKNKVKTLAINSSLIPKLGANVVALGGKESGNVVSTGIITEIKSQSQTVPTDSQSKDIIVTDMVLSTNISGWLLFDTSGNLLAIEKGINDIDRSPIYLVSRLVLETLKEYL